MSKYSIPDDHVWADEKEVWEREEEPACYLDTHDIAVVDKDTDRDGGYRYEFHIAHGEEDYLPIAFPMRKQKWAGNFWREMEKLDYEDWEDIPSYVKARMASVVEGVDHYDELEPNI